MVGSLPPNLEWSSHVSGPWLDQCRNAEPFHRCLRYPWIRGLLQWFLVQGIVAASSRAFLAFHSVAGTICHRGSSSCVGSQASWTPHQVPLRQSGCGSHMVWSVLSGSQDHEPSSGVVLCCCMQQLHNPTCACPRQTQPTGRCIVLELALTVFCSCPTG